MGWYGVWDKTSRPLMLTQSIAFIRPGTQRHQNRQGSQSQSFHESNIHTSHEQNQDFHTPHIQSTTGFRPPSSQERQDYSALQSTVQSRYGEMTVDSTYNGVYLQHFKISDSLPVTLRTPFEMQSTKIQEKFKNCE